MKQWKLSTQELKNLSNSEAQRGHSQAGILSEIHYSYWRAFIQNTCAKIVKMLELSE